MQQATSPTVRPRSQRRASCCLADEGRVPAKPYTLHDIRKRALWGNLMAGGAGVEYYFGYTLPENDLICEDFRSRDKSWDYCRIALELFSAEAIPFAEMTNANALIGNTADDNSKFCLAKPGDIYLVYLPTGGETPMDLSGAPGPFTVRWFNPREGGWSRSTATTISGGSAAVFHAPDGEDWLAVIVKAPRPPADGPTLAPSAIRW